jgi:hypothetical protein
MKYLQLLADYMYPPLAWFDNPPYTEVEIANLKKLTKKKDFTDRHYFSEYFEDLEDFAEYNFPNNLIKRIESWDAEFQATLADYPPDSKFPTPEDEERHYKEGLQIAKELANFFKGQYKIQYYVNGRGEVWIDVD